MSYWWIGKAGQRELKVKPDAQTGGYVVVFPSQDEEGLAEARAYQEKVRQTPGWMSIFEYGSQRGYAVRVFPMAALPWAILDRSASRHGE